MKYNSIREYFYKLHSVLYAFVLLPLLCFAALYWWMSEGELEGPFHRDENMNQILLAALGGLVLMEWIISTFLFVRGLRMARKLTSLGDRLDRYYAFTLVRFAVIMTSSLALAVGFYLTENQWFTMIAGGSLLMLLAFWPGPAKVCRDLKLKGDERTLVLYKKDRL
jgi:hypothetical protein